jgi:hypothetical protein
MSPLTVLQSINYNRDRIQKSLVFANSPYTALPGERTYLVDASSGSVTINLPTAVGITGKRYKFVKTDTTIASGANQVVIEGSGSETVGGSLNKSWNIPTGMVEIESDGANWIITDSKMEYYFDDVTTTLSWTTATTSTINYKVTGGLGSALLTIDGIIGFSGPPDAGDLDLTLPYGWGAGPGVSGYGLIVSAGIFDNTITGTFIGGAKMDDANTMKFYYVTSAANQIVLVNKTSAPITFDNFDSIDFHGTFSLNI